MELNKYPMLEEHISVSEITTKGKSDILIYDTVTGARKYPNRAVFHFLKLASGAISFEEIVEELSRQSGEPFHRIWAGLSHVAEKMVKQGLLKFSDNPFKNLRKPPPSVEMV